MSNTSARSEPAAPTTELLIALGRDREAVEAATRATTPGGTMDGAHQLDVIIPQIQVVVDGISADQIEAPTACANFAVRGVLEHMIGGVVAFAPGFRGEPAPDPVPFTGLDAEALTARWKLAMAELLDAMHSPGADERILATPMGEAPGATFARFVAFDGIVHGWDLATATGQAYAPDDDLVEEIAAFAHQALAPEMRDGDTFAAETEAPADASSIERLVAFSGRRL